MPKTIKYLAFILAICFCLPVNTYTQSEIDSLLKILPETGNSEKARVFNELSELFLSEREFDKAREFANKALISSRKERNKKQEIAALNNLATEHFYKGAYQSSIINAKEAIKISTEINDLSGKASSLGLLGNAFYYQGKYQDALESWLQSLEIWQGLENKDRSATLLMNIGVIYKNRGDYKKAITHYEKALKIHEEKGNKLYVAQLLGNIGNIYFNSGIDYDKALEYYENGLALFQELEADSWIAQMLNSIGLVYDRKEDVNKALEYYTESLKVSKAIGDSSGMAHVYGSIGNIYLSKNDYYEALSYFQNALRIFQKLGLKQFIASTYGEIGNVYLQWEKYQQALDFFQKSISLMKELDLKKELLDNYHDVSKAYAKLGQFEYAYEYYKKYSTLNDSIFSAEYANQITEWRTRYETEKKEQELQLQKAENLKKEAELKRKNIAVYSAIAVVLIVLIFSLLLYKQVREKQKANILLKEQNQEIKTQRDKIFQQNQEITDSIEYASRIQTAMLPPKTIIEKRLPEHFILYKPRDIVSGDFYWLTRKDHRLFLCAADCTGHGVPGAFMSMLGIALLNEITSNNPVHSASGVLDQLRTQVVNSLHQTGGEGETQDGMDIAFCIIDTEAMKLQFAGAFNPLFIIRNGEMIEIKGDKMPIGVHIRQDTPFTNHQIPVYRNDQLYIFSDGYPDQFGGPKKKKFLLKRFRDLLMDIKHHPMAKQKELLENNFYSWKGDFDQIDDILVFGVKI